jgi:hypothetical protein
VLEHWASMCEALNLIPTTIRNEREGERERDRERNKTGKRKNGSCLSF